MREATEQLSYENIKNSATQIGNDANKMKEILDEVKALLDKIGSDGVWSGDTASKKKADFDSLSAKFPQFSQAVKDCSEYIINAVSNYEAVDKEIQGF